jgi:hypothetical protein
MHFDGRRWRYLRRWGEESGSLGAWLLLLGRRNLWLWAESDADLCPGPNGQHWNRESFSEMGSGTQGSEIG